MVQNSLLIHFRNMESKNSPKRKYSMFKVSEATEILATERLILEFLHNWCRAEEEKPHKNIKKATLYEFRVYIQKKKDSLDVERAKD